MLRIFVHTAEFHYSNPLCRKGKSCHATLGFSLAVRAEYHVPVWTQSSSIDVCKSNFMKTGIPNHAAEFLEHRTFERAYLRSPLLAVRVHPANCESKIMSSLSFKMIPMWVGGSLGKPVYFEEVEDVTGEGSVYIPLTKQNRKLERLFLAGVDQTDWYSGGKRKAEWQRPLSHTDVIEQVVALRLQKYNELAAAPAVQSWE